MQALYKAIPLDNRKAPPYGCRMDTKTPIQRACDAAGSMSELARRIEVRPPTVHQWVTGLRPVPSERCPQIERVTGGLVTCEELRPDLAEHWAYLRGTSASASPDDEAAA